MSQAVHHHLVLSLDLPQPSLTVAEVLALQLLSLLHTIHKCSLSALFSLKASILIHKCHPYTGNLNSETPGDSKNAFLHREDVLGHEHRSNKHSATAHVHEAEMV